MQPPPQPAGTRRYVQADSLLFLDDAGMLWYGQGETPEFVGSAWALPDLIQRIQLARQWLQDRWFSDADDSARNEVESLDAALRAAGRGERRKS
jgi:hypothetical protein